MCLFYTISTEAAVIPIKYYTETTCVSVVISIHPSAGVVAAAVEDFHERYATPADTPAFWSKDGIISSHRLSESLRIAGIRRVVNDDKDKHHNDDDDDKRTNDTNYECRAT